MSPTTARCRRSEASRPMAPSSRSRASRRRISRQAGARAGWRRAAIRASTTCFAAMKKLADGRLCSNGPTQHAIAPALLGDRSHQVSVPRGVARARGADRQTLSAIPGFVRRASGGLLRNAQGGSACRRHRREVHRRPAARDGRARVHGLVRHEAGRRHSAWCSWRRSRN